MAAIAYDIRFLFAYDKILLRRMAAVKVLKL